MFSLRATEKLAKFFIPLVVKPPPYGNGYRITLSPVYFKSIESHIYLDLTHVVSSDASGLVSSFSGNSSFSQIVSFMGRYWEISLGSVNREGGTC